MRHPKHARSFLSDPIADDDDDEEEEEEEREEVQVRWSMHSFHAARKRAMRAESKASSLRSSAVLACVSFFDGVGRRRERGSEKEGRDEEGSGVRRHSKEAIENCR